MTNDELRRFMRITDWKLNRILQQGRMQKRRDEAIMTLGTDILTRVTNQGTSLDSFKELLTAWVEDNSISQASRDEIFAAFDANAAKSADLEKALQPNPAARTR